MLPLLLLEDPEEELWLEDPLEGVLPVLSPPDCAPEIAVAATMIGAVIYLKNLRHIKYSFEVRGVENEQRSRMRSVIFGEE